MSTENKNRKATWRIVVGIISVLFIVYMWVKKDIVAIYTTMPKEQIAPMIATTIAVSLIKVGIIACAVLFIKRIIKGSQNKHD